MRGFVANTDYDWFTFLRAIEPPIDEVNFWKPGSGTNFGALVPGEPLFFKLKAPHRRIEECDGLLRVIQSLRARRGLRLRKWSRFKQRLRSS